MGKKLPQTLLKISTLIAILASPFAPSVGAYAADGEPEPEKIYWTIEELIDLKAETDAYLEDQCPGDYECYRDLRESLLESDAKYRVLNRFESSGALITAINPEAETIRAYFSGENIYSYIYTGVRDIYDLNGFYLAWMEDSVPTSHYNEWWTEGDVQYRYPRYVVLMQSDSTEDGMHSMIAENTEKNGAGWFERGVERYYSVAGSNLLSNTSAALQLATYYGYAGGMYGPINYSGCINAGYRTRESMECRLVFSEADGATYRRYYVDGTEVVDPIFTPDPDPITTPDPITNPDPLNPDPIDPFDDPLDDPFGNPDNPFSSSDPSVQDPDGTPEDNQPGSGSQEGDNSSADSQPNPNPAPSDNDAVINAIQNAATTVAAARSTTQVVRVPYPVAAATAADKSNISNASDANNSATEEGITDTVASADSSTAPVATPTAGVQTTTAVNFPWWLVALLVIGDVAVVWWFLPSRKKHQKDQKQGI